MDKNIQKYYEELSKEDIKKIEEITDNDFDNLINDKIINIHNKIKEYCESNIIDIYNVKSSYNIYNFIKNNTKIYEKLYNNNLNEKYKDEIENGNNY
jgi:hypothetical protein